MLLPVTLPVPVLRGLVLERFGVSEFATSLFMAINNVGALLTAPLSGAFADRYGRRRATIVGALLAHAVLLGSLALDLSFGWFLFLRFVEGAAQILALSLLLAVVADNHEGPRRGRAMGMLGCGLTLGVALGAPLGGMLGRSDALRTLHVGAAILLVAAVVAALVVVDRAPASGRPGLRQILRAIAAERALLVPLAYAFVDRFTVGFFTTTFPLFLERIHGFARDRIGFLLALFLLPFALLSYPSGRLAERRSRVAMVVLGSLVYGAGVAAVGWVGPVHLVWLMVGLGLCSAVMFVPSLLLAAEFAAPGTRSTALAGFNAAGSLGFLLGPVVGGGLSSIVAERSGWLDGYRVAFGVAGAAEVLCVIATWPLLRALVRAGRTR